MSQPPGLLVDGPKTGSACTRLVGLLSIIDFVQSEMIDAREIVVNRNVSEKPAFGLMAAGCAIRQRRPRARRSPNSGLPRDTHAPPPTRVRSRPAHPQGP